MPNTQQGAGLDIVKASILHQKFDGSPGIGAGLDFIQKHQGFPGNHRFSGIGSQAGNNGIGIQIPVKYLGRIRIRDEIDLHKTIVLVLAKLANNCGLSNLTGTHDA